jgi:DNA-binding response OmpR family regulator
MNDDDHNNSRRILIVDDDIDITTSLKIGLEENGFRVDVFNYPLSALSNFKRSVYDLLLLDIIMPELNGLAL